MAHHVFYPSPEMPDQIVAFAEGVATHKEEFGAVTGCAPADLKGLVHQAGTLKPMADEIEALQLTLAAKLDAYHKAAAPAWTEFSERLGYAHTFAKAQKNAALEKFLLAYKHNVGRHAAAKHAAAASAPAE